jgi:broad specificity phosphatase PhoE
MAAHVSTAGRYDAHIIRRLFLIRHADPEIVANLPAADWCLSARGVERAKTLASRLTPLGLERIYSSPEPKAMQTAGVLGEVFRVPIVPVLDLREHDRRGVALLSAAAFEQTMRRLFSQPSVRVFGNETAEAARRRFERALLPLLTSGHGDIMAVTHGTVLTLAIADRCRVDPFDFWKRLGLPSAVSVLLPDMLLEQVTNID